ncbi:MAG: DUF5667 domain-containing protein [Chloroflexota bacterium]
MGGERSAKDTVKLIEEVARGDRLLEDITNLELRETVRLALRLHKDPYSGPDGKTRSRIRVRVLNGLRPRQATFADSVAVAFELLGRPTPYAMRALAVGLVVVAIGASTAVASAGTVADDALYSVKVSSEQMRLALAMSPEDRAVVQLSIAEHRLAEAIALATLGNEDDAIVATSEYGEHMANAAAELAQVEALQPETATLVIQLQQRIDEHRATAAAVVARLAEDPTRASASAALAALAARGKRAAHLSPAAAIAQDAADTADEAASVAERMAAPLRVTDAPRSSRSATRTRAPVDQERTTRAGELTPNETTRGQNERSSKERASVAARKAADEAKAAAKKAKHGNRSAPASENYEESDDFEESHSGDGG